MQRSNIFFYLFLVFSASVLIRCANPVTPQGGPKDVTPPVVVACEPANSSVRFSENSFTIEFDEFVTLKNPVSEVFISPPLKSPLDTRLRGRSLIVKMDDSLAPNTTYSVTFGKCITDITEGNILTGFNYVFSTGDYVDTLSLQGNLITAFDLKPQKDVFVELYINNNDTLPFDSLPLKVPPYYLTKSDEQGNFMFRNLQNAKFKLFALADQNGDLIFNQPSEKIAFFDSLVSPYYVVVPKPAAATADSAGTTDSLSSAHAHLAADSVRLADSLQAADTTLHLTNHPVYSMRMFEESDSVQRLLKVSSPMEHLVMLAFRFPVRELSVVPLNFDSVAAWSLTEMSRRRDTARLWITRPSTDSLIAGIIADGKVVDTVRVEIPEPEVAKKNSKKQDSKGLGIFNPVAASGLNQYKNKLVLTFSRPLVRWDFKRVLLIFEKDTITPEIAFTDSLKRQITVSHKWEEAKSYKILVPDSVFFGLGDVSHDTVMLNFRTKGENDFGNLRVAMTMKNRPGQYIVQLINEKESVVYEERIINGPEKLSFEFMPPGKYKLKAIFDRNRNNRWDTGDYKRNQQPEEVMYYSKIIEIRANWDLEETWD